MFHLRNNVAVVKKHAQRLDGSFFSDNYKIRFIWEKHFSPIENELISFERLLRLNWVLQRLHDEKIRDEAAFLEFVDNYTIFLFRSTAFFLCFYYRFYAATAECVYVVCICFDEVVCHKAFSFSVSFGFSACRNTQNSQKTSHIHLDSST